MACWAIPSARRWTPTSRAVAAQRAGYMEKIRTLSFADIRKDPQLLAVAETAGRITFANNCQPCHGAGGGGRPGYPALAAGDWLWGGTLEATSSRPSRTASAAAIPMRATARCRASASTAS